jgi:hypothetical protein
MATVLAWSIPGGTILLVLVGMYELMLQKKRRRAGTPLSGTYVNEVTAMFYGTKRMELDYRDSSSLLREEESQGAPPAMGIDLDRGRVIVRPDSPDQPGQ